MLTTKTFRKIEVDMDMSRNSLLKLKRILKRDVKIEAGVREVLRKWDKVGVDQLELHRIDNFELKVAPTRGKK